jgi:hypothetical protein
VFLNFDDFLLRLLGLGHPDCVGVLVFLMGLFGDCQLAILQLEAADVVLEILQDASQGVVDLAEVSEQDGGVVLVRGRGFVELEVRVSVHFNNIYMGGMGQGA